MDTSHDELWEQQKKEIDNYLQLVITPHLPKQFFEGISSSGSMIIPELSTSNRSFQESKYFYDNDLNFIHYTNLKSFFNIINERSLRLNDFNFFDDPQEFVYGFQKFDFSSFSLTPAELKSCLFAISFCQYNDVNNPDDFDMWRLYGDDGFGVAFTFTIDSEIENWRNFHLSNVYYSNEDLDILESLKNKHDEFFSKTSIQFQSHLFDRNGTKRFPLGISILLGFHKNSIYKVENEVRLLRFSNRLNFGHNEEFNFSFTKSYEETHYIKVPLKIGYNNQNLRNDIPEISINKLILGYRYSEKEKEKIQKIVDDLVIEKLNKRIEVEISPLKKYFN